MSENRIGRALRRLSKVVLIIRIMAISTHRQHTAEGMDRFQ